MTTKWLLLLLIPFLLGFSTSDNIKYVAEYKSNEIEAEVLFKELEGYAILQGFELVKRIKETVPKKAMVSELKAGVPFQGGVILELILDEDTGRVSLEASRYHGGCSKSESIKKVDEFRDDFQHYIKSKYAVSINMK